MDEQKSKRNLDLSEILSDAIKEPFHKIGKSPFYENTDKFVIARWSQKYKGEVENYWYGLKARDLVAVKKERVTHFAYVLGSKGLILLPKELVMAQINKGKLTNTLKKDGSLLHYHIRFYVENGVQWVIRDGTRESVGGYFIPFSE